MEKKLGKGAFATVFLGYNKETGIKYAIKEMNKVALNRKKAC
jgi:serine/threonine protein kinase